jgi:hypothetical protein
MSSRTPAQAIIGLSGLPSQWGGLPTMQDRVVRLVLPDEIGPEHIASMQAECERLADLAGRHPKTMAVLQNAVLQGDQQATDQAIDHLGLRQPPAHHVLGELAVVGLILVVLLAAGSALSGDSGTAEPVGPEGGVPGNDAGDAGAR